MAANNKLLGKLVTATKQYPKALSSEPWSHLRANQIAYDDTIYNHSFRAGTMPTTVRLYQPILKAVEMLKRSGPLLETTAPDYLLVSKHATFTDASGNKIKGKESFLELLWKDGSATVMYKRGNSIRISDIESDGTNNPIGEFKLLDQFRMAGIYLLCMPEILEADHNSASGKLAHALDDFASFIPDFPSWTSEADIPDLAKESAFFTDALFCYANDHAGWEFADPANSTATVAEQIDANLLSKPFKGSVIACSNLNVAFQYAASNGSVDSGTASAVTIAEAKAEFSVYSSHRRWTKAEEMMIPYFAPDTPVMPEVIRLARRILGTRDAVNPVCNAMWRGVTAYGKSTGVKQLAHILNMPLLILTCHPTMEISDFKSTFVPESESEGLELDMTQVALTSNDSGIEMSPNLELAIQNISAMEKDERDNFLSGSAFFMEAMMDAEGAAQTLLGKEMQIDSDELCKLYTDAVCYFREKPLRFKIAHLEAGEAPAEIKEKGPGFKHIMSNYIKALINGYIVEIQELSRIRDSGVAVGINEYDHAGAVIHLMNGAIARRHKDAICIITDNVGYASSKSIDQSVIRRQALVIDSYELTEQMVKDRARRNTGCKDTGLLNRCYGLWAKVKEFCETNSITEGSVSPMELERFVQAVMLDGEDSLEENLADCVISKATSSIEDQRDIRTACGLS